MRLSRHLRQLPWQRPLLAGSALAALAAANAVAARRAERKHPPQGRFVTVDGVRLHVTDRGAGTPVVLIHGNMMTGSDWDTSGVAELLLRGHRVIAFDRPGFGHSPRPRGRAWTAEQQADLLHAALRQLGVERPVVVGHSWGAIVALALAQRHPGSVGGLALVSGYYFWTVRPDVAAVAPTALPVVGDVLRYTVSPLLGLLGLPLLKRVLFGPAPVTGRFKAEFADSMALRPSQIRATSVDGALMIPAVLGLQDGYARMKVPAAIVAGSGDRVVWTSSAERLHAAMPGSTLHLIEGAGHMVHHTAPGEVARVIEGVVAATRRDDGQGRAATLRKVA